MSISRRQVVQGGIATIAGLSALSLSGGAFGADKPGLRILVLGGTGFLGPHLVKAALERGHTLTLFNRGRTGPGRFPDLETLTGDRGGDLSLLKDRTWDVVVDTSSFIPAQVAKSAALLKPNVGHYIFVSSVAVYKKLDEPGMGVDAPVYDASLPEAANYSPFERYGAGKYNSEQEVLKYFPENGMNIRSDTIVGPGDHKHFRYPYWIRRATQGGTILGPGSPGDYVQYVDVRDLAEWIVYSAENGVAGTFNATSEPSSYTMEQMIADCLQVADASAPVTWVDSGFLSAQGVVDIPFWVPDRAAQPGLGQLSTSRAVANGLGQRPKLQTARDTLEWFSDLPPAVQSFDVGPTLEQEAALLDAWKKHKAGAA